MRGGGRISSLPETRSPSPSGLMDSMRASIGIRLGSFPRFSGLLFSPGPLSLTLRSRLFKLHHGRYVLVIRAH